MTARRGITRWMLLLVVLVACLPPSSSAAAAPARLYVGQMARLTAQIPASWTIDPVDDFDYKGPNGFIASTPLSGPSLAVACATFSDSPAFDTTPVVVRTSWAGRAACRLSGYGHGVAVTALVVPHPHPFTFVDTHYAYAALVTDPAHFASIVATLNFSPDRVTAEAYIMSVIDILQARAYWGNKVDWSLVRQQAQTDVDGLTTMAQAQGELQDTIEWLRAAGDNHSHVVSPTRASSPPMLGGFGALVGGSQVLQIYPGGPADRAGVRQGDIIEAIDGVPFSPLAIPADPATLHTFSVSEPTAPVAWTVRRPGATAPLTMLVAIGTYSNYVPPTGRRLPSGAGYLALPSFATPGKRTAYSATANQIIAAIDASPTCGWVIDLRLDSGGSYMPMITAVGPVLGDGVFGGWRTRDGGQTWVTYQKGRIIDNGQEKSNYLNGKLAALHEPHPPVAILIGPMTTSAGEMTTMAFVKRPGTRLFGEPTAGATTGVQSISLFDGTDLALAETAMTDRTGATHLPNIVPNQEIATDWTTYGTAQDPVLAAAQAWLRQQPACAATNRAPSVAYPHLWGAH